MKSPFRLRSSVVVLGMSCAAACGQTVEAPSVPVEVKAEQHTNRLASEQSPYLLQHATNPVDWYPWGGDAFAKAKRDGKPVFLSIGYSTCHWCHVMERESFEDAEIAAFLNEHFVAVKVDREERPDIDAVYVEFVRARTGTAGWPLTVILTPDRHPFFGGTYFPPRNVETAAGTNAGLLELLRVIADEWKNRRAEIEKGAESIAEAMAAVSASAAPRAWNFDASGSFVSRRLEVWRREQAEGASAPRFPEPTTIELLLLAEAETGDARCLDCAIDELDALARGGIFDPIGGGFARYGVDARYLVPHFEKMLYVNALLAQAYTLAFQRTRDERHADVARQTLEYLLRDMRVEDAAFATAEDADSANAKGELEEGQFYTFTPEEVRAALPPELASVAIDAFCLEAAGHLEGRSIPNRLCGRAFDEKSFELARRGLFELRSRRPRPLRDDKVLAGENGLAISAFALAGRVLREPRYLTAARTAADFVCGRLVDRESGAVMRRYRRGETALQGQLADYAYLAQGLFDLYSATLEPRDLELAILITDQSIVQFYDVEKGVLYDAPKESTDLIARPRDAFDGAMPSPTAIAVENLVRTARLTGRTDLEAIARRCLDLYADDVEKEPLAFASLIEAEMFLAGESREAVFAGVRGSAGLEALLDAFFEHPRPFYVIAHADPASADLLGELIEGRSPASEGARPAELYLCKNRVCLRPISDPSEIR